MMIYRIGQSLAVPLMLLQISCSTLEVSYDYDTAFDFASLKTYQWLQPDSPPSTDVRINNSLISDRIRAAVDNNLTTMGFSETRDSRPDFYVTWLGIVDKKLRIDTINQFYGSFWPGFRDGRYWAGFNNTYVSEYETGTLIIDIHNPGNRKLIWRGSGVDYLIVADTPEKTTEKINRTVSEILKGFPPPTFTKGY